eukprot:UN10713
MSSNSSSLNPNDININHQLYALRYTWSCDEYTDCTDIEFMDEAQIPNLCPDKCLEAGYTLPPTIRTPTTAPTIAPTFDCDMLIFVIVAAIGMVGLCMYNKRKMKRVVEERYEPMIVNNTVEGTFNEE